jgi:uncharacterized YigZ family protein
MKDTYLSLSAPAEGSFRDKGSRFLSFVFPCENEEEMKAHADDLRKKYFDATHHCYAYRFGYEGEKFRANDDGEPSGSAGLPILGQLKSKNLTNIFAVVVRYYGGTKLGVSGLINAYKEATNDALLNAQIIEKIIYETFEVRFEYEKMNLVMSAVKKYELKLLKQNFDNLCIVKIAVRRSFADKVAELLADELEVVRL